MGRVIPAHFLFLDMKFNLPSGQRIPTLRFPQAGGRINCDGHGACPDRVRARIP